MSKSAVAIGLACFILVASPASTSEDSDERLKIIVERLESPIHEISGGKYSLSFLLDMITAVTTPPGADKNRKLRVSIKVNRDAFSKERKGGFDPERTQINIPAPLTRVSLGTVLEFVCRQFEGVYVVRDDYIEIIPTAAFRKELHLPESDKRELFPLVSRIYSKSDLDRVITDLSKTYSTKIVLSPKAKGKGKTEISARLLNVPLEMALDRIVEKFELNVVKKGTEIHLVIKDANK